MNENQKTRAKRNNGIRTMAKQGVDTDEIAARYNLAPSTVIRVIYDGRDVPPRPADLTHNHLKLMLDIKVGDKIKIAQKKYASDEIVREELTVEGIYSTWISLSRKRGKRESISLWSLAAIRGMIQGDKG